MSQFDTTYTSSIWSKEENEKAQSLQRIVPYFHINDKHGAQTCPTSDENKIEPELLAADAAGAAAVAAVGFVFIILVLS